MSLSFPHLPQVSSFPPPPPLLQRNIAPSQGKVHFLLRGETQLTINRFLHETRLDFRHIPNTLGHVTLGTFLKWRLGFLFWEMGHNIFLLMILCRSNEITTGLILSGCSNGFPSPFSSPDALFYNPRYQDRAPARSVCQINVCVINNQCFSE